MEAGCWTRAVLALAASAAALSCGSDVAAPTTGEVKRIALSPSADTLEVGSKSTLRATVLGGSGDTLAGRTLFWNSENPDIATVSDQGVVTAVAPGTARIAASAEGVSGLATVHVSPKAVRSIVITPSSLQLRVGQSARLQAATYDGNGNQLTGRSVSWSSNNTRVANVDNSGQVTAGGIGSATITAASGNASSTARVTVTLIPVDRVQVDPSSATLLVGKTTQLSATTVDSEGNPLSGRSITWSSNRSQIASVSAAGLVTAAAPGNATITATSEGKSGSSAITVQDTATQPVNESNGIEVSPSETTMTVGQKTKLSAKATSGKTKFKVKWSSSNALVARVADDGTVTALLPGTATITARADDGRSGTATVTVTLQ